MDHSIGDWLTGLEEGDSQAVNALWRDYFPRLVGLARTQLDGLPKRVADEEDVALSAFKSFCKAAQQGRFPDVRDRDDLWRLLLRMTVRKAVDQRRYHQRQRRGGGKVRGESVFMQAEDESAGIGDVVGDAPSPELAAQLAEELEVRLLQLEPDLRELAVAKMEGYTNPEIARQLSVALSTVERRLRLIRKRWEQQSPAAEVD